MLISHDYYLVRQLAAGFESFYFVYLFTCISIFFCWKKKPYFIATTLRVTKYTNIHEACAYTNRLRWWWLACLISRKITSVECHQLAFVSHSRSYWFIICRFYIFFLLCSHFCFFISFIKRVIYHRKEARRMITKYISIHKLIHTHREIFIQFLYFCSLGIRCEREEKQIVCMK